MTDWVDSLLTWYAANARALPWRSEQSPYRTWVSEIMLQQTQVDTVIPYFERWMDRFSDIEALAEADDQDVLGLWEGLGYYSRARNLHKAAEIVTADYAGRLPETSEALQKLPGIGPYTAAAIASIAFDRDVAAVDGNIRRVFSRLYNITAVARSKESESRIWELAQAHLPRGKASAYNQALMDLGATLCTPKSPVCDRCPVAEACQAWALGVQEERPVKKPRKKVPHLTVTAAVIQRHGKVLLSKRPAEGLLGGLWEFPGGTMEECDPGLPDCLQREIREELGVEVQVGEAFGVYKHAYTHFKITLNAFLCTLRDGTDPQPIECDELIWVDPAALGSYPMGKVDRQIADRLVAMGADHDKS
ncbi:MAG: A/G-specific adenine glycosylase [Chloroflexota bacterium]|nr:A/G-specific adenine glycosylase [Chloroflexota bacterium]